VLATGSRSVQVLLSTFRLSRDEVVVKRRKRSELRTLSVFAFWARVKKTLRPFHY
jgi:hypothetical protein